MENSSPDIIIIRGAPGSGKSQVAKELSKYFPKGVRLEVDSLRKMVISVDWTNQVEHVKLLQVSIGLVQDFLRIGFQPIILVDTFSGDKLSKYLEDLHALDHNLIIEIFGLYVTDDELKRRLELRINGEFNDFGISKKINDDLLEIKYQNEIQINTTGHSLQEIANRILLILNCNGK